MILITGASSGIGYDTTEMLAKQGHKVYGAARRVDSLKALANLGVEGIAMDVTDDACMEAGVKQIIDKEGRIDVLINKAGYGSYGPIEGFQYMYKISKAVATVFFHATIVIFWTTRNPTWQGISMGLTLFGLAGLAVDFSPKTALTPTTKSS